MRYIFLENLLSRPFDWKVPSLVYATGPVLGCLYMKHEFRFRLRFLPPVAFYGFKIRADCEIPSVLTPD